MRHCIARRGRGGTAWRPVVVRDTGIEPVTSSVSGKRATAAPIARAVLRGGDGIRTRVYGFAGRCLASRPLHRSSRATGGPVPRLRADDGIRTRDPHLGKVMLYQLSHVRTPSREAPFRCMDHHSRPIAAAQNRFEGFWDWRLVNPSAKVVPRRGDWRSGSALRSHRRGHWFDPSIAHPEISL